jgi:predicted PurR-regulated permease PerM
MHKLQQVVGGYARGQVITSLCIMAFTFVMLVILRVPNALALSALAFLGDMIPIVGVFVIIVPTALAAWQVSTASAVIVVVLLILYTQFENKVLVQRVYGATLNLPSTAVLLGLMVGGQLFGAVGALLSLPVTASLAVLTRYWHDVRAGHDPALTETVISPVTSDVCPSLDDVCPEVERAQITVA